MKKTNLVNARLILSEYYEFKTNIYNHVKPTFNNPLAAVSFHDAEDITNGSLLEEAVKKYVKHDIQRIFGLNLEEYLSMPLDITILLERVSSQELRNKNNALDKIESDLKNLEQG